MNLSGNPLEVPGVTPDSQAILDLFLEHYRYTSAITFVIGIRRLRELVKKPNFTKLDYNDFIYLKDSLSSQQFILVTRFFRYLYANNFLENESGFDSGICYWSKDIIITEFIKQKEKKDKKRTKKDFTASLTLIQLEKLKTFEQNCFEDEENPENLRLAYCFHVLFYDDIDVNILRSLDAKDFDNGEILTKEGVLDVPEEYWSMFLYFKSRTMSKFSILNDYVRQLGKIVGIDNLTPINITKARKQNSWICPECGNEYLSFAENWKCINNKFICNECAENLLLAGDVKKNLILSEIENTQLDLLTEKEHKKIEHHTSNFEKLRGKLKPPCDFDSWNAYLQEIGDLGQKYIVEQEKLKLLEAGLDDLAERVTDDPASDHNNGYDVLSYTLNKKEIHIEVKATPGEVDQPFYISYREKQTAENAWESGTNYEIHRVYNVQSGEVGRTIYKNFDNFDFENIVYKVSIKKRVD